MYSTFFFHCRDTGCGDLQVAAADLGIPLSSVYIAETATDKVPNSSPTAASASSDMYGSAAADACAQLNARLKPYREQRPDSTFTELVNAAYLDRVDLSAHGFYATPDVTGDLSAFPSCVCVEAGASSHALGLHMHNRTGCKFGASFTVKCVSKACPASSCCCPSTKA